MYGGTYEKAAGLNGRCSKSVRENCGVLVLSAPDLKTLFVHMIGYSCYCGMPGMVGEQTRMLGQCCEINERLLAFDGSGNKSMQPYLYFGGK